MVAGVFLALALATAVWAYLSSVGAGTGNAAVRTLGSPAPVSATSSDPGTAHVTWSAVTSPSGTASDVTYVVERSSNGGASYASTSGTCSGSLSQSTTSCDDSLSVAGSYAYRVTAHFKTWTSPAVSNAVAVVVDATPPTSTITFPATGAFYNAAGYAAGCAPLADDICGTAADPGSGATGVNKVQVAIQRSSDSKYWNGSAWVASITWNDASGTSSWSYVFSSVNLTDGVTYTVQSQATDNASNTQTTPASASFFYDATNPVTASVTTPASGGQFRSATVPASFAGSAADNVGGAGLNANSTTFTLRRSSDGNYWTGATWQVGVANLATTHAGTSSGGPASWTSNVTMPTWAFEADGTFTVQASATDKAGNAFAGTAVTFTLDKTNPVTASVTSPANGSSTKTFPSSFSGSAADNSGGVGLNANSTTYTLQRSSDNNFWTGSAWQASAANLATSHGATTGNTAAAWTSSAAMPSAGSLVDATYTIQATATDKVGNAFTGSAISFTLDRVNPITASVTTPATNAQFRPATVPATFAGSAADNAGGVGLNANSATFTLQRASDNKYWDGVSAWQTPIANLATTHTATTGNAAAAWASNVTMPTWTSEADGTFTVQASATDKAGNTFAGTAITFTLDKTSPVTASVTSPANGSSATTFPATFSGSAADNSGGVGLNASSTTYTLQRSTDGNYWTGSVWQASAANLATTHSATTGNTAAAWTSSSTMPSAGNLVDATYTIQATATDKVGNTFTGTAVTFALDRTNPITASVTSPASGSSTNNFPTSFSGSAADNAGGAGLNANSTTYTLKRSSDNNFWTGAAWQASAVNLATTHAATTGNTAATWTSAATMPSGANLVDATYTVTAKATDKAGNSFTGASIAFTYDKTNPVTASVSTPANGSQFRASTVPATFSGSAADNTGGAGLNANSTTFTLQRASDNKYWDGSTWVVAVANLATSHTATTSGTAATWTSTATMPTWSTESDGNYSVQATATDKVGNTFTGTAVTFTLDRTNPITASVTSPASGSFTNTFPGSFGGNVADNSGGVGLNTNSATYTLQRSTDNNFWSGSAWQASATNLAATNVSTTDNTSVAWTSAASMPSGANLVDATYTVRASATDKVGNTFTGAASTFLRDSVNPTGSITAPAAGSTIGATVAVTSSNAADASSGVSTVQFQERLGSSGSFVNIGSAVSNPGPYTVNWDTTTVANGSYQLQAIITDQAGNSITTPTVTVTVSNTFTVSASTPQTAGTAFNVTLTAKAGAATNTNYSAAHTIVFTGPSSSPNGTAPTYPATVSFANGVGTATVTLVKAETTTITATEGNIVGTSGSIVVNASAASRLAWTHVTVSKGTLSSPCLFTCTDTGLGNAGTFTANVSVTDALGNTVTNLGSGHTVTVSTPTSGTGSGGQFTSPTTAFSLTLTIASSGAADSTQTFTFQTQNGSWTSDTFSATTLAGTVYTGADATVTKS